jgi:lysozyme
VVNKKRKPSTRIKKRKLAIQLKWVAVVLFIGLGALSILFISKKILEARRKVETENVIRSIPYDYASFGIDVSHHQGEIDWSRLFLNYGLDTLVHFVYCKTTEGEDHLDSKWYHNRHSLRKLDIPHGAYHFFRTSNPKIQADFFLTHWKHRKNDLPPMLDVEYECINNPHLVKDMQFWLKRVENKTGQRPIIYTSFHLYETKFKDALKDYKFWIACYSQNKPKNLDSDERIIHWQYSSHGNLPGLQHRVDLNVSKLRIER